ncbi:uncharacterized protein UV8b_00859 [Ustilaginoidea virens]|uniref:Uncharacterized protein n=1 Tax=Ustilaginoidea virens TaxID=1159556 RepID=A0A8E5HJN3_USTVR|nr:uncharacterized protein UV8b_00859 [Ustilaginoidea virens]QUC16618.1 hypothetical protein UV8b_00859 [Ustilaginoidea virens]
MGRIFLHLLTFLGLNICLLTGGANSANDCAGNILVNYQPLKVYCQDNTYVLTGAYTSTTCTDAQYITTATTQPPGGTLPGTAATAAATAAASAAPSPAVQCNPPGRVLGYALYGCVVSGAGFPGLGRVAATQMMSLQVCAASCTKRFFGVYKR